jgi:putative SOS response-associated peptidase YedK
MCFHKSAAQKFDDLMNHYSASFQALNTDLEPIRERFSILMQKDDRLKSIGLNNGAELNEQLIIYSQKDALPATLSKQELSELKWCLKTLTGFKQDGIYRYHENGFDYLPTPIVTAGDPNNFKLFRWGLIPFYMSDKEKAMVLRTQTLNCISEEMYEKPSFKDAIKNGQRCLIPVTGFYEWRWLDEQGTVKIPYYITFRDQKVRSMAGLYSRWKDKETGEYYYSYTVLTTKANAILEYVHNNKKRMPVFIAPEDEKTWLTKDLTKEQVMELCQPYQDPAMRAYTISKLLTTKNINTNVPEVMAPMNYNTAIQEANQFFLSGDKKKALEAFKNSVSGDKIKIEDLQNAATQTILSEVALSKG